MFTPHMRNRLEATISTVIGLELWLTGELDLTDQELTHLFSSLQARMAVIQAIAWPDSEADGSSLVDDDSAGVD